MADDEVYTSIEEAPEDDASKLPEDQGDSLAQKMTEEFEKEGGR